MPFPPTPRVIYANNPLVEVICQFRFPTILEISAEQPARFQNKIRRDYPIYEKSDEAAIPSEILASFSQFGIKLPGNTLTHQFLTEDRNHSISLADTFVAVSAREYTTWEAFRQRIELAKDVLEEIYEPSYYVRIGLRYQNFVNRVVVDVGDVPWSQLLNTRIAGPLGDEEIGSHVTEAKGEFVVTLDEIPGAQARIRHGTASRAPVKPATEPVAGYLLDIDVFTEERNDSGFIFPCLDSFNQTIGRFFRWSISERLGVALGPMEHPS